MRNLKVNGIVLREGEFGEGDKITVFSDTNELSVSGKARKRTGYRYLALYSPFAYSSLSCTREEACTV